MEPITSMPTSSLAGGAWRGNVDAEEHARREVASQPNFGVDHLHAEGYAPAGSLRQGSRTSSCGALAELVADVERERAPTSKEAVSNGTSHPPRMLRVEVHGLLHDWFDVADMGDFVRSTAFAGTLRENVSRYFGVPLERQAIYDEDGLLTTCADFSRALQRVQPKLFVYDLDEMGPELRARAVEELKQLDADVELSWRQFGAGQRPPSRLGSLDKEVLTPTAESTMTPGSRTEGSIVGRSERSCVDGGSCGETGPSQSSNMVGEKKELSNGQSTGQQASRANGTAAATPPRSPRVIRRDQIAPGGIRTQAQPLSPCTPKVDRFLDAGIPGSVPLGMLGGIAVPSYSPAPMAPYGTAYSPPSIPVYRKPGRNLMVQNSFSDYQAGSFTPRSQFRGVPSLPGTPRGSSTPQAQTPRSKTPVPVPVSPLQQHRPAVTPSMPSLLATPRSQLAPAFLRPQTPPPTEGFVRPQTPPMGLGFRPPPFELQLGRGLPEPPGISFDLTSLGFGGCRGPLGNPRGGPL